MFLAICRVTFTESFVGTMDHLSNPTLVLGTQARVSNCSFTRIRDIVPELPGSRKV